MKKSEFLKDVEHEVKMLKQHATLEELSNLGFNYFDPQSPTGCIYGQMTGNCTSIRANELMNKSCVRVWDLKRMYNDELLQNKGEELSFTKVKEFINGKFDNQGWSKWDEFYVRDYHYLSALEGYIGLKGSNVEHIFDYLTGKVDELKLK